MGCITGLAYECVDLGSVGIDDWPGRFAITELEFEPNEVFLGILTGDIGHTGAYERVLKDRPHGHRLFAIDQAASVVEEIQVEVANREVFL